MFALVNSDLSNKATLRIEPSNQADKSPMPQIIAIDTQTNEEIVFLINQKAAAGYTTGFSDENYVESLPQYRLPFLTKGRSYRAFEVIGESMLPLMPQSIVIGEAVTDVNDVKNGTICVVVTKADGIVLKEVSRVKERNTLQLVSKNIAYKPYEVPISEVSEMWKFVAYISKDFPENDYSGVENLHKAYQQMQLDIQEIKTKLR